MSKLTIINLLLAAVCCNFLVANSHASILTIPGFGIETKGVENLSHGIEVSLDSELGECEKKCYTDDKCQSFSFCQKSNECVLSRFSFESELLWNTLKPRAGHFQVQAQLDWNPKKIELVNLKKVPTCEIYMKNYEKYFRYATVGKGNWAVVEVAFTDDIRYCAKLAVDKKADSFLWLDTKQTHLDKESREEFNKILKYADLYQPEQGFVSHKRHNICAIHGAQPNAIANFSAHLMSQIQTSYGIMKSPQPI